MNLDKYKVTLIVGNEYELIVNAYNSDNASNIALDWDETEENASIVSAEEIEVGRQIKSVEYFNDICSCCQETQEDCKAASVETGKIVQTLQTLHNHYMHLNADTTQTLAIVLDAYLTNSVSPCNQYSRG